MRTPLRLAQVAGVFIPMALVGCSAGLESIPLGRWEGTGKWEGMKRNEAGQLTPASGEYCVTATFTAATHEGRRYVAATVLSDHPAGSAIDLKGVEVLMLLGRPAAAAGAAEDKGSLEVHSDLEDTDRSEARTIDAALIKTLLESEPIPPARVRRDGLKTRLELVYVPTGQAQMPNEFTETFTFSGGTLVKSGVYRVNPEGEYIRWTEHLKRTQ